MSEFKALKKVPFTHSIPEGASPSDFLRAHYREQGVSAKQIACLDQFLDKLELKNWSTLFYILLTPGWADSMPLGLRNILLSLALSPSQGGGTRTINAKTLDSAYENKVKLAEGGYGVVYSAKVKGKSDLVAIKEFKNTAEALVRFEQELYEAFSKLNCPQLLRHVENVKDGSTLYLVTELITGAVEFGKLGLRPSFNKIKQAHLAYIMKGMCEGLAVIHAQNFAHLDIKGRNLLIGSDGTIKLIDYGLTKGKKNAVDAIVANMGDQVKSSKKTAKTAKKEESSPWYVCGGVTHAFHKAKLADCERMAATLTSALLYAKNGRKKVEDFSSAEAFVTFIKPATNYSSENDKARLNTPNFLGHEFLTKACSKAEFATWLAKGILAEAEQPATPF